MIGLPLLRRYANLLDKAFRIPGTNIRFGLDPIAGLIPGLGDLASPIFAGLLIVEGTRLGIPKIVLMRMVVNALIDAVIGAVPLVGTVGDVFFRANTKNVALLERHAAPGGHRATRADYTFVWVALTALVLGVIAIVWFALWLAAKALGMLREML
ncbi:MAG TPA: DUF4112 domain-containing protein [Vicinamibacterales bacterium]|nr:DUF4112 domain-containing protein [Vicinamibacterales bacterium]